MLQEVGFWCQLHELNASDDGVSLDRPDPHRLVDDAWAATADPASMARLRWFLTRGAFIESHELAYSYCRFADCSAAASEPRVMGACTLTDGVFCWPEAYWHYVECHHVKPPSAFLAHVEANYSRLERIAADYRESRLLWDAIEERAVSMPRAMHDWITTHTTLQVASKADAHTQ